MMLLLAGTTEPAPDRTGVIDPIQERGKSPNRELGGHELRVPKWAPIRRKTTEKSTNSGSGFDGIGGYFQGFRRGAENCKTFMRRLYRLFFNGLRPLIQNLRTSYRNSASSLRNVHSRRQNLKESFRRYQPSAIRVAVLCVGSAFAIVLKILWFQ